MDHSGDLKSITTLRLIIAILIISGCDQMLEESQTGTNSQLKITQVNKSFEEPGCTSGTCAQIKITSVKAEDNHRIDQFVDDKLKTIILDYTSYRTASSMEQGVDYFFADYADFKKAFPESITPWELTIDMEVDWMSQKKQWLSFKFDTYSYTGGAHPSIFTEYVNIDKNGKQLDLKDWINDEKKLRAIGEDRFRKLKNIPWSKSLADAGYTFDDETFNLPENIGFKEGKLILHYNDYEISNYADGPTILEIPLSEISTAISF